MGQRYPPDKTKISAMESAPNQKDLPDWVRGGRTGEISPALSVNKSKRGGREKRRGGKRENTILCGEEKENIKERWLTTRNQHSIEELYTEGREKQVLKKRHPHMKRVRSGNERKRQHAKKVCQGERRDGKNRKRKLAQYDGRRSRKRETG